jgi:hypothetical protein
MTLWALRGAVLGDGPWRVISSEENMQRLQIHRETARHKNHIPAPFHGIPYFNAYATSSGKPRYTSSVGFPGGTA